MAITSSGRFSAVTIYSAWHHEAEQQRCDMAQTYVNESAIGRIGSRDGMEQLDRGFGRVHRTAVEPINAARQAIAKSAAAIKIG